MSTALRRIGTVLVFVVHVTIHTMPEARSRYARIHFSPIRFFNDSSTSPSSAAIVKSAVSDQA